MNLDEILFYVGDFGKFQKLIICLILLPAVFPCGFHAYNQLFMATNPKNFWCNMPENFSNNQSNNKCIIYDTKEMTTVQCRSGWSYEIDDIRNSVISEWDLVCAHNFAPTLSLILFGCSGLMGNYIFGYIQDSFGRKPSYYIYLLIQCIFGIATSLANNYTIWTIFRMGVGFTVPAILGTPYVLAIELVGPNDRTTVTILINIAYSVSLILLAIIVWAIRSWRILALSTTLPFFGLFFTWFWLPESPRWLLSQGKYKEVKELLRKIGRINNRKLPENLLNKLEQPINNHNHNISINRKKYGIKDLFHKKNLRWKTIIITGLWFTNISVYVGLSYYAPSLGGDEYLNFFLAGAVELPTYLFLWPAMEKLGRRWTLCLSMIIGGTSCLGTFLVQNNYTLMLILYCIGKMGISSAFVVLPLMASELYPTVVRGLGMSLSSVVGMLGPIFIPLVNYLGSDIIILPLIIMGIMLVIGGFCALLLPETLHQHLPQTLEDAEITGLKFFASCSLPQKEPSSSTLNEENKF